MKQTKNAVRCKAGGFLSRFFDKYQHFFTKNVRFVTKNILFINYFQSVYIFRKKRYNNLVNKLWQRNEEKLLIIFPLII